MPAPTPITRAPILMPLPANARPQLVVGGSAVQQVARSLVDGATNELSVAAFRLDSRPVLDSLQAAAGRNVVISLLADEDGSGAAGLARASSFADVRTLGADPHKQHSKAVVADRERALVATDLADDQALQRLEVGVTFSGRPSRQLAELLTQETNTPAGQRTFQTQAAELARNGVLVNDPGSQVFTLTTGLRDALRGAQTELLVSTKSWDDPLSTKLLANNAAEARQLITHHIPKRQRKELERAGVRVTVIDEKEAAAKSQELHGTVVAVDGQALITSAYFESRVLDSSKNRQSRELGVAVGADTAKQAAQLIRHMDRAA